MAVGRAVLNKARGDNSFISFISALLVFLAVLLVIHLILFICLKGPNQQSPEQDINGQSNSALSGYEQTNQSTTNGLDDRLSTTGNPIRENAVGTTSNHEHETFVSSTYEPIKTSERKGSEVSRSLDDFSVYIPSRTTETPKGRETPFWIHPNNNSNYETNVCKKTAANMLYMMDHGGNACEDFYDYACGGNLISTRSPIEAEHVLEHASQYDEEPVRIFKRFYGMCTEFHSSSFDLKSTSLFLDESEEGRPERDITELIYQLMLTQSFPFFDIGLTLNDTNHFNLNIAVQGSSSLKTTITRWSMFEEVRSECLQREIRNINVTIRNYKMDECAEEKTKEYIERFEKEMKFLAKLYGDRGLEKFLDYKEDLQKLLKQVTDCPISEMQTYKLEELQADEDSNFGLDWSKLLRLLDNATDHVQVSAPTDFDCILREIKSCQTNITGILELWSRVQLYYNMKIKVQENYEEYCWTLVNELMPDVSNMLVSNISNAQINENIESLYQLMFREIKLRLHKSIEKASWMSKESQMFTQNVLQNIVLNKNEPMKFEELKKLYQGIHIANQTYPQLFLQLLRRYRSNVIALVGQTANPSNLGTYFLNPYESRPQSFQPTNIILYQPVALMSMNDEVPRYVTLVQHGFTLAQEIAKSFEGDRYSESPNLDDDARRNYGSYFSKDYDNIYKKIIIDRQWTYNYNGKSYSMMASPDALDNSLLRESTAFRLIWDLMSESGLTTEFIWLNTTYDENKIFLIMTAQEYCESTSVDDIATDFIIKRSIPAPLRVKILMENSDIFSDKFNCPALDTKLGPFPYIPDRKAKD